MPEKEQLHYEEQTHDVYGELPHEPEPTHLPSAAERVDLAAHFEKISAEDQQRAEASLGDGLTQLAELHNGEVLVHNETRKLEYRVMPDGRVEMDWGSGWQELKDPESARNHLEGLGMQAVVYNSEGARGGAVEVLVQSTVEANGTMHFEVASVSFKVWEGFDDLAVPELDEPVEVVSPELEDTPPQNFEEVLSKLHDIGPLSLFEGTHAANDTVSEEIRDTGILGEEVATTAPEASLGMELFAPTTPEPLAPTTEEPRHILSPTEALSPVTPESPAVSVEDISEAALTTHVPIPTIRERITPESLPDNVEGSATPAPEVSLTEYPQQEVVVNPTLVAPDNGVESSTAVSPEVSLTEYPQQEVAVEPTLVTPDRESPAIQKTESHQGSENTFREMESPVITVQETVPASRDRVSEMSPLTHEDRVLHEVEASRLNDASERSENTHTLEHTDSEHVESVSAETRQTTERLDTAPLQSEKERVAPVRDEHSEASFDAKVMERVRIEVITLPQEHGGEAWRTIEPSARAPITTEYATDTNLRLGETPVSDFFTGRVRERFVESLQSLSLERAGEVVIQTETDVTRIVKESTPTGVVHTYEFRELPTTASLSETPFSPDAWEVPRVTEEREENVITLRLEEALAPSTRAAENEQIETPQEVKPQQLVRLDIVPNTSEALQRPRGVMAQDEDTEQTSTEETPTTLTTAA